MLNLLSDDVLINPYPHYATLREHAPVHWDAATNSWYVMRYREVYNLLSDSRLTSPSLRLRLPELSAEERMAVAPALEFFDTWMVFSDDPATLRLRKSIQRAFSPASIQALESEIASLAAAAIASLPGPGADLLAGLVRPFAMSTLAMLLGIARAEVSQVRDWSAGIMSFLDELNRSAFDRESTNSITRIINELSDYVTGTVLPRGDGLLTPVFRAMMRAGDADSKSIASTFAHVLTGGLDPIATTMGVGVIALHGSPEQRNALRAREIPYEHVVEEALRYDPPFHFASRQAAKAIGIGGTTIRPGERVALGLASANRDELEFTDAGTFNARRPQRPHLAFGRGHHYCLGSLLARREMTALLYHIETQLPTLQIVHSEVHRKPLFGAAGFQAIPIFI
jgi:cytochrome P450